MKSLLGTSPQQSFKSVSEYDCIDLKSVLTITVLYKVCLALPLNVYASA